MPSQPIAWPRKTREFRNHHMDSTRWNDFPFRDDDIVIATWAKSGTTWMQQILGQLIFDAAEDIPVMEIAPWLDMRALPLDEILTTLEQQEHRRFMKTHLPLDALVFSPQAKYLYIGRDPRDTLWSLYHHHCACTDEFYEFVNGTPGLVGEPLPRPKDDIVEYYHEWLDKNGHPFWEYWSHTRGWWEARTLPNVLMVHFNNLKADMPAEMQRIAEFLGVDIDASRWPLMVEHCTFDYMKAHAAALSPMLEMVFRGGGSAFVNKGTNERWRDVLSAEEVAKCDRLARENLGPECAHWLVTGELPQGRTG